jgi:hypothetical protein
MNSNGEPFHNDEEENLPWWSRMLLWPSEHPVLWLAYFGCGALFGSLIFAMMR